MTATQGYVRNVVVLSWIAFALLGGSLLLIALSKQAQDLRDGCDRANARSVNQQRILATLASDPDSKEEAGAIAQAQRALVKQARPYATAPGSVTIKCAEAYPPPWPLSLAQ